MNLKQLEYFVEVVKAGSVTRAAQRLHVAQPALTRHLKALESDLGAALFQKVGRGIGLTPAGSTFFTKIETLLAHLRQATLELRQSSEQSRSIKLGISTSLGPLFSERLMRVCQRQSPPIDLHIVDGWSGFLADWLVAEQLEVSLIYDNTIEDTAVETQYLASEAQYLVGARGSKIAGVLSIALGEVARLPLILPSKSHGLRRAVDLKMAEIGTEVTPILELDSSQTIRKVVERGGCYSVFSQSDIVTFASENLMAVPIVQPLLVRDVLLAWRKDTPCKTVLEELVKLIQHAAAELVQSGVWGIQD